MDQPVYETMNSPLSSHSNFSAENIKTERYDGYYSDGRKRPGIKPKIPDEELSPEERHHREKRRLRNKEAASRCRKKKDLQVLELQDNANDLKSTNQKLESENKRLKTEIEQIKFQLQYQQNSLHMQATSQMQPNQNYFATTNQAHPTATSGQLMNQPLLHLISPIQFLSPTLSTQPTMFFPDGTNFQPSPRLTRLSSSDILTTA